MSVRKSGTPRQRTTHNPLLASPHTRLTFLVHVLMSLGSASKTPIYLEVHSPVLLDEPENLSCHRKSGFTVGKTKN